MSDTGPYGDGRDYTQAHYEADRLGLKSNPNRVRELGGNLGPGVRLGGPRSTGNTGWGDYGLEPGALSSERRGMFGLDDNINGQEPGLGPGATTGQIMDYVANNYPGMIGLFNIDSGIRATLIEAAKWGWTPGKVQAAIQNTAWYRGTSASARDFAILEANDPTEAKARVSAVAASIQNSARTMGLGLSSGQIAGMATTATRNGWTDAQTIDALLQNLNWSSVQGGQLTANVDDIKAIAGDYLVDISDSTAQKYAARMASGELTLEGVRSVMQRQAKGRFSWMEGIIDQGVTPSDYFMPVQEIIARTLEVTPDSINLMDPKWLGLVEVKDEESGQMRAATLNEAMLSARNTGQFVNTQGAEEMSAGLIQMTKEAFGL